LPPLLLLLMLLKHREAASEEDGKIAQPKALTITITTTMNHQVKGTVNICDSKQECSHES
jgi:hypothetical protein